MEALFWISVFGVLYPYLGYPALLWLLGRVQWRSSEQRRSGPSLPSVSLIVPVHNEESRIVRKVENCAALEYPAGRLQVVFVSDGSSDRTTALVRRHAPPAFELVELPERGGKAAALNAGLNAARHEVVVFTDASIQLQRDALQRIAARFEDEHVGCVSGEDRIADAGGEGLYGRYELLLRRLESRTGSIVGASGSFYAQRRSLCRRFLPGMAPDFLSVLETVEQGYRAVSEPSALGAMTSVQDPRHEFERKVRTLLRGMTTLFGHARLLNPFRYGLFSFALASHKVMRWLAPIFMGTAFLSSLALARSPWYLGASVAQLTFYLAALAALAGIAGVDRRFFGKIALYFSSVNIAVLAAWVRYLRGVRQELWTPSRR